MKDEKLEDLERKIHGLLFEFTKETGNVIRNIAVKAILDVRVKQNNLRSVTYVTKVYLFERRYARLVIRMPRPALRTGVAGCKVANGLPPTSFFGPQSL